MPTLVLMLFSCGHSPDEQHVKKNVHALIEAINEKNNGKAMRYVSDYFYGGHKRGGEINKQGVRKTLAFYFLRYKHINLTVSNLQFEELKPGAIRVYGTAIVTGANELIPDGRLYQLSGRWKREEDNEWRLDELSWE